MSHWHHQVTVIQVYPYQFVTYKFQFDGSSLSELIWKISQNSQGNTCAGVFFRSFIWNVFYFCTKGPTLIIVFVICRFSTQCQDDRIKLRYQEQCQDHRIKLRYQEQCKNHWIKLQYQVRHPFHLFFCKFISKTGVIIRSSRVSVNSLKILNPFIPQRQPFTSIAQNNCFENLSKLTGKQSWGRVVFS